MSKGEIITFIVCDFILCGACAWAMSGSLAVGIMGAIFCAGVPCGFLIASEGGDL